MLRKFATQFFYEVFEMHNLDLIWHYIFQFAIFKVIVLVFFLHSKLLPAKVVFFGAV